MGIRNSEIWLFDDVSKTVDSYLKNSWKKCRDLDIRKQINHHLHITLTEFSYPSEELEIYFSLYSTKENCYVSEKVLMPALPSSENNDQGLFTIFVAFCSFFPCSLTVVHRGRQWKSGGRQWKSSRAGRQNIFSLTSI